jgi:hypothetical protein
LLARIREVGRRAPASAARRTAEDPPAAGRAIAPEAAEAIRLQALETRLATLEKLVQGLQDSVYRETQRQEKRLAELEARVDPAALAVALSKDARDRGL